MRVVRGSLPDVDRDREVTRRLADGVDATGEPALRAWTPPRQVAFGRRDAAAEGYDRAREAATDRGYEPIERSVGGHAVAYTGDTVAFAYGVPTDDERGGIRTRYREMTDRLRGALEPIGTAVRPGEPEGAFCPGEHSLRGRGKIAGLAQRVHGESALVGGCVVVERSDEADIADVLGAVYPAIGVPFDPASVGSVEAAGGPGDPRRVVGAIETAFLGDGDADPVPASELLE